MEIVEISSEIKMCHINKNYATLPGLIEHWQFLGNELEAALEDKHDLQNVKEKLSRLKSEYKELQKKVKALTPEKDDE